MLETVNRRVPTFIGTTSLGAHEVVDRMRFVRDRGADGVLLSRKYSEMRLDNLRAAGAAIRELGFA